jgi:hypothetical protein
MSTNQKRMPRDLEKKLKMKWVFINTRVRSDLTAVIWKDKRNVDKYYHPSEEGNFCGEDGNAQKPVTVQEV